MNRSRYLIAFLASIGSVAFAGIATGPLASDVAPLVTQAAPVQAPEEVSSQGRRGGGGNVGRIGGRQGGNVGRIGRQGGNVGRVGRIGRIDGRIGRIDGRIGRQGRIGRFDGRIGRVGRVGFRYGRIGRIGYVPVPVPLPVGPGGPVVVPGRVVSPTCPVCPVQACLVAVYADPNLTGLSVETDQNQPRLDQSQWQNQISSIMVKSGTWDFYPELEFRGQPLRLSAGSFPVLEPQWTKRIGSFMCVR